MYHLWVENQESGDVFITFEGQDSILNNISEVKYENSTARG